MFMMSYRISLTTTAAAFAVLCAATASLRAQQQPSAKKPYIAIDYMKILPKKAADAAQLERVTWLPLHQERVRAGKIDFWRAYTCQFPSGSEVEYDYITITQYPSFAEFEAPYGGITDETITRILPNMKRAELVVRTEAVRKLVREDVFSVENATSSWPGAKANVLYVVYLKAEPGRAADLAKILHEFFLPLNEELVKKDREAAWASTLLRFPYSASAAYDSLAFNAFETLADMESGEMPEPFKSKWKATSVMLDAARTRVRNQLWMLQVGTKPR